MKKRCKMIRYFDSVVKSEEVKEYLECDVQIQYIRKRESQCTYQQQHDMFISRRAILARVEEKLTSRCKYLCKHELTIPLTE